MTALAPPRPTALLLDAGFTLTFPDPVRIAALARAAELEVDATAIAAVSDVVRRDLARYAWATHPGSASPRNGGVAFFELIFGLARPDAAPAQIARAAAATWAAHLERNVWARVGDGVAEALERAASAGFRLAVVSNSEGTVEAMLREVGLARHIEAVIDSWVVGVSKPDPAIFRAALERLGVAAEAALMIGDSPTADVAGARAAGIRAVLIDPLDLHLDHDGPRFRDLPAVVAALLDDVPAVGRADRR